MIFPELLVIEDNSDSDDDNNINEEIKMEEKRLFFLLKLLKQVKDLNFQNYIVKSELEKYKKTVEKINKDNQKIKGVTGSKFIFNSERNLINKKPHKKKCSKFK